MNLILLCDSNFYVITKLFLFWKELCISYPKASKLVLTDYGVEVLSVNLSSLCKINGVETREKLLTVSLHLQGIEIEDFPFITLKGILSIQRRALL
ncbi:hypothetical protein H5410_001390 [Solanum commersonii]|uniref:Uncharacterized protein n=1 Tax=Solanum commersonii TaxID=4109 RepID=A0A9J6AZ23_SOLCO|nr:hypothetical protein H5410_001390 [Solanum commersonii]